MKRDFVFFSFSLNKKKRLHFIIYFSIILDNQNTKIINSVVFFFVFGVFLREDMKCVITVCLVKWVVDKNDLRVFEFLVKDMFLLFDVRMSSDNDKYPSDMEKC
jgi:hypothetical protein